MSTQNNLITQRASLSPTRRALLEKWTKKTSARPAEALAIPRRPEQGPLPLSFAQQRLWVLDQLVPDSPAYNISLIIRLSGRLDAAVLERSLNEIVRRHETLRTTFS